MVTGSDGGCLWRWELRKCAQCGREFLPKAAKQRFCSNSCRYSHKDAARGHIKAGATVTAICARCGTRFSYPQGQQGRRRKWCSDECRIAADAGRHASYYTTPIERRTLGRCIDCDAETETRHHRLCADCWRKRDRNKCHRRRAGMTAADAEQVSVEYLAERDGARCTLCGRLVNMALRHPAKMSPSIDHVIPVSLGGTHIRANCQLAHLTCNISKGSRTWVGGEQLRIVG